MAEGSRLELEGGGGGCESDEGEGAGEVVHRRFFYWGRIEGGRSQNIGAVAEGGCGVNKHGEDGERGCTMILRLLYMLS